MYLTDNIHLHTDHRPWSLQRADVYSLDLNYKIGNINLTTPPELAHYSHGVQVIAWKREIINQTNQY
ncbi:hypothetical protein [Paraflavitalea speifideaquila]|uniref:hypothetical protein n=1 Tax=Paraflavitalea speifideaquila TaxID=3076558 RepID=UPI0028E6DE3E|nr:hypothetical protein [Paraflavitalea speifideiaquila]